MDWHAGMLSANGGMERLRAAERSAKEKRLYLYANQPGASASGKSNGATTSGLPKSFDAVVVRVWSGDQISVVPKDGGKERRIQLSSTRAPKCVLSVSLYLSTPHDMSSELLILSKPITLPRRKRYALSVYRWWV